MQLHPDPESEKRIARIREHLPDGKDLILLILKGHLLVEEVLDELIAAACPEPQHILDRRTGFAMKARIAQSLSGHLLLRGLWPMVDALNTLRNDLAHNLDSPKLQDRLVTFMNLRKEHMNLLYEEPIDPAKWDATAERLRMDISLLVSQLTGGALAVRTLIKKLEPWNKMREEMNKV